MKKTTIDLFTKTFRNCGFIETGFVNGIGIAEFTLALTYQQATYTEIIIDVAEYKKNVVVPVGSGGGSGGSGGALNCLSLIGATLHPGIFLLFIFIYFY